MTAIKYCCVLSPVETTDSTKLRNDFCRITVVGRFSRTVKPEWKKKNTIQKEEKKNYLPNIYYNRKPTTLSLAGGGVPLRSCHSGA